MAKVISTQSFPCCDVLASQCFCRRAMEGHISARLSALAIHLLHNAPPTSQSADHIASGLAHEVAGLLKGD